MYEVRYLKCFSGLRSNVSQLVEGQISQRNLINADNLFQWHQFLIERVGCNEVGIMD